MKKINQALAALISLMLLLLCCITTTTAGSEPLPGDVNDDGFVNIDDALAIAEYIFHPIIFDPSATCTSYGGAFKSMDSMDVNGDGNIDINDIVAVSKIIFGEEVKVGHALPPEYWPPKTPPSGEKYTNPLYFVGLDINPKARMTDNEIWLPVGETATFQFGKAGKCGEIPYEILLFTHYFMDGDNYVDQSALLDVEWWHTIAFNITGKQVGTTIFVLYGEQIPYKGPYTTASYPSIFYKEFTVHVIEPV